MFPSMATFEMAINHHVSTVPNANQINIEPPTENIPYVRFCLVYDAWFGGLDFGGSSVGLGSLLVDIVFIWLFSARSEANTCCPCLAIFLDVWFSMRKCNRLEILWNTQPIYNLHPSNMMHIFKKHTVRPRWFETGHAFRDARFSTIMRFRAVSPPTHPFLSCVCVCVLQPFRTGCVCVLQDVGWNTTPSPILPSHSGLLSQGIQPSACNQHPHYHMDGCFVQFHNSKRLKNFWHPVASHVLAPV